MLIECEHPYFRFILSNEMAIRECGVCKKRWWDTIEWSDQDKPRWVDAFCIIDHVDHKP